MEEKKTIQPNGETKDEELDQVAGGLYANYTGNCPNCGSTREPVWDSEKNMYVCANPACRARRSTLKPQVQTVV